MSVEIERKFLLKDLSIIEGQRGKEIIQAYISKDKNRTVRIRIKGDEAFITIKGLSNESGMSRFEWEKPIDLIEAKELLHVCLPGEIKKTRYKIPHEGLFFEIDIFHDQNEGLNLVEIELSSEEETFSKPTWLGKEVTGDKRYYNSYISENPFNEWK